MTSSDRPFSSRFVALSLAIHGLAIVLLWWGAPTLRHEVPLQIRMVRLAGGGQNRPGWVSEAVPAAEATDSRVEAEPIEALEPERRESAPPASRAPVVARTPDPARAKPSPTPAEPVQPRREATQNVPADGRPRGGEKDTGAGPRGLGSSRTGATADSPELPGMSQYLVRVENAIQRAFKYPARSSGRRAVFHFLVDRNGQVTELEQVLESGLPGLDLSGKSAVTRAVLPPLPVSFPYDQIGVTFTFVDE